MLTETECPMCGGEMEEFDRGSYKGFIWNIMKCTECDYKESDEPDYDSEYGGHDY